jgi:hypothetical protein
LDKTFGTGRKVTEGFKETMRIKFDEYLPQWNVLPALHKHKNSEVI